MGKKLGRFSQGEGDVGTRKNSLSLRKIMILNANVHINLEVNFLCLFYAFLLLSFWYSLGTFIKTKFKFKTFNKKILP